MFSRLFGARRQANRAIIDALYEQIVAAARQPTLYASWLVPDTPLGRFEMIGLHTFLLLDRLHAETAAGREIAQEVTDTFFADVDQSLRILGIGDNGVPKRMKKLGRMFYGRTASYSDALRRADARALAEALMRNVRPGAALDPAGEALAHYVMEAEALLGRQPMGDIAAGRLSFPDAAKESR